MATRNTEFLLDALRPDGKLRRSWRQGKTTNEAFLEDYAALAASAFPPSDDAPALVLDRLLRDGKPTAYVCESFVCKLPVNTVLDLQGLL